MTYDIFLDDGLLHTGILTRHDVFIIARGYSRDREGTVYVYLSGSYAQETRRTPIAAYRAGERVTLAVAAATAD